MLVPWEGELLALRSPIGWGGEDEGRVEFFPFLGSREKAFCFWQKL
jgi:hypothetical protein